MTYILYTQYVSVALATTVHAYKGIKSGDGLQPNCPPITPTPTATTYTHTHTHNLLIISYAQHVPLKHKRGAM